MHYCINQPDYFRDYDDSPFCRWCGVNMVDDKHERELRDLKEEIEIMEKALTRISRVQTVLENTDTLVSIAKDALGKVEKEREWR